MPSSGLEALASALAEYRPGDDLEAELLGLAHFRDRLDLLFSELAGLFADSLLWEQAGYTSPIAWLRHHAKMASGVAADRVFVGIHRQRVPESALALERGQIGFSHLALMVRTSELYRGGTFDEAPLLEKARVQTVTHFRRTCEHVRHAQDPLGFCQTEAEAHEARYLELSQQEDGGVWLRGWLDAEGGARVRSALEPLARPSGRGDDRSRKQRLADALVESVAGAQETELVVTCSLETLEARPGAPAAEAEWGGLLSGRSLERLACHGVFRRLLLDADSVVIDLGRRQRLLSPPARRALEARDRHCVWPGCDRPARWCQSHHRTEWREGGETSVKDSALLCGRHHRMRHEMGWQLYLQADGKWKAIPPRPSSWPADLPGA